MHTTQEHIAISDISNDMLLLSDGGAAIVLLTSAVNFGLLSEREQLAIIDSFAQMLNSLSFPIQIIIRSKKLDISSYIKLLQKAQYAQTNTLLAQMMEKYRHFIQSTIKENEVLDKQFYVVIPLSYLEMGLRSLKKEDRVKKSLTVLLPRRDQMIRQLNRVGLKTTQLVNKELLKLFYDIYNPKGTDIQIQLPQVKLTSPQPTQTVVTAQQPQIKTPPPPPAQPVNYYQQRNTPKAHPFVVEELIDTI